jgi:tetratricopeptide (TPR) repeat protein
VAYVDSFALDYQRDLGRYRKLLADLHFPEVAHRDRTFLHVCSAVDQRFLDLANKNRDLCYQDLKAELRYRLEYLDTAYRPRTAPDPAADRKMIAQVTATKIFLTSPHAPAARAHLLDAQPPLGKDLQAARNPELWERECQHPYLWRALGQYHAEHKKLEDAERCLKQAIRLSPDASTYRSLAEMYRAQAKTDQWIATLEAYLQEEDHGLDHARVRVELANYFMAKKDFARALPYAEAAAETWAGWAMLCASECHEGLGNWEKAEQWVQGVSLRYPDSSHQWFFFVQAVGQGERPGGSTVL